MTRGERDDTLLTCERISKKYGATPALNGVSLSIAEREIVAVTGESGSGKSTLLLCCSGLVHPADGDVIFEGARLGSLREVDLTAMRRKKFGFVFQMGHLVPDLSAVSNVALPLMLLGWRRKRAEGEAMMWLERLGVQEVAQRPAAEMSGGQVQRVAVARALIHRPRVVFADEPTGALDSRNAAIVLAELVRLARDQGSAVLIVTHSVDVAGHADRTITMRDGQVSEALATR